MNDDDLVAEARAEAIRDGDPETCLVWDLADAIERLQADLAAAKSELGEKMDQAAVHYGGVISTLQTELAAANAEVERLRTACDTAWDSDFSLDAAFGEGTQ
jgi:hypothetical protein